MEDEKEPNTIKITPITWSSYAVLLPDGAGGGSAMPTHTEFVLFSAS
jgi:hypothetical protein